MPPAAGVPMVLLAVGECHEDRGSGIVADLIAIGRGPAQSSAFQGIKHRRGRRLGGKVHAGAKAGERRARVGTIESCRCQEARQSRGLGRRAGSQCRCLTEGLGPVFLPMSGKLKKWQPLSAHTACIANRFGGSKIAFPGAQPVHSSPGLARPVIGSRAMGIDEARLQPQVASQNGLAGTRYEARPALGDNLSGPRHPGGDLKDVARLIAELEGGGSRCRNERDGADPKGSAGGPEPPVPALPWHHFFQGSVADGPAFSGTGGERQEPGFGHGCRSWSGIGHQTMLSQPFLLHLIGVTDLCRRRRAF